MNIIKLSKEQIKSLKGVVAKNHDAQVGYEQACHNLRSTKDNIFKKLKKLFPDYKYVELDWEDKELIINDSITNK